MADIPIERGNLVQRQTCREKRLCEVTQGECYFKMEGEAEIRLLQVESGAPSGWKGQGRNLPLQVSEKAWPSFTLTLESYLQNCETTSFCGSEFSMGSGRPPAGPDAPRVPSPRQGQGILF